MERGDAADHAGGPHVFNQEPDGFAVLGGVEMAVEYVDPALHLLLPELTGDLAHARTDSSRRVFEVAGQVLTTGVSALVKGLSANDGRTVDIMLKRIEAEEGSRVLAIARVRESEPEAEAEPRGQGPPPRYERVGPVPTPEQTPPFAAGPTVSIPEAAPEQVPARVPVETPQPAASESKAEVEAVLPSVQPSPSGVAARAAGATELEPRAGAGAMTSLSAALEHIGLALQSAHDVEQGLEQAIQDAAVALGSSTASIMLRRNRTLVVEVTYRMPAEYRGLRFRDDEPPHGRMSHGAGQVVAIENVLEEERPRSEVMKRGNILAVLAAPLLANDERIGVVYFNWTTPQRFGPEQRTFVASLTSLLAPHAQVLRLTRVADREAAYIATLLAVISGISRGGLRSSIAAVVLEVMHDRLGLDYGDIRIGEDHRTLRTLATLHGHETLPTNGVPSELGRQAVFEQRTITGRTQEAPEGRDLDAIRHISVPFEVGPDLVGVMDLSFLGSRRFAPDEMELFSAIGRLIGLAFRAQEDPSRASDTVAPNTESMTGD